MKSWELLITCAKGLEGLLVTELEGLGLTSCKESAAGVRCTATLAQIYQACLWSRLANRIFLPLLITPAGAPKEIYDAAVNYNWESLLKTGATIAVDFKGSSEAIRNTMFGGQIVKDGIVDRLSKAIGTRPSVEPKNPDCLIQARLHNEELTLFYDLSGHSLHQRGYRRKTGDAPLKENLAAAILMRAGFSAETPVLIDPFCGSGTLLIEAAMMATDKAPGLDRLDYGFLNWQRHDTALWDSIQQEALERHENACEKASTKIYGFDSDNQVLRTAQANVRAAGLSDFIHLEEISIKDLELPDVDGQPVLFVSNPPYGERMGVSKSLIPIYKSLGDLIRKGRSSAAILTSDPDLARATGLWSHKQYSIMNAKIPCKLYLFKPKPIVERA